MSAIAEEREQVQLSLKCGPAQGYMWNLRGPDVATVVGHLKELVAFAPSVNGDLGTFQALESVGANFTMAPVPAVTGVSQSPAPATTAPVTPPAPTGTRCPVNPAAWHNRKQGIGKTGNEFDAIFCKNVPPCATQWLN